MFIQATEINSVYVHVSPVDFRKGINGLGCEVTGSFGDRTAGKNLFDMKFRITAYHPPATFAEACEQVRVLQEKADASVEAIFEAPREAYTRALLAAAFDLKAAEPQIVAT